MQDIGANEIVARLEKLLAKKGWSRYELAKKTGISTNSVYGWTNMGKIPSLANIERICDVASITVEQFFYDEGVDGLSEEERNLLSDWVTLSEQEKQAVFTAIEAFKEAKKA